MNNFVVRTNPEVSEKNGIASMDYGKFISTILATNSNLVLNPNSQLAKVAVDQYNTKVKQTPTLIRPPIPSWFCGYQNTETGQLYLSEYELETARNRIVTASASLPLSAVTAVQVRYDADRCLSRGIPGSYSYSFCNLASSLQFDNVEADVIDWSTAFYPVELITDAIEQISTTVFDSVQASIAVEAARLSGNTEWNGASGTGVWDGKDPKIKSYNFSGRFIVLNTEGIVGNSSWPSKTGSNGKTTYAALYINGGKTDWCTASQLQGGAKTLENMYDGSPSYWRRNGGTSISYGSSLTVELRSTDGRQKVSTSSGPTWPFTDFPT